MLRASWCKTMDGMRNFSLTVSIASMAARWMGWPGLEWRVRAVYTTAGASLHEWYYQWESSDGLKRFT